MDYPVCPDCGAVCYGNLSCRTCRADMRQSGCKSPILDQLDATNLPTIPPVSAEEIRAFLKRLGET